MTVTTVPVAAIGRAGHAPRPDGEGSLQVHLDPKVKIGSGLDAAVRRERSHGSCGLWLATNKQS